jgi:hypothetical protein
MYNFLGKDWQFQQCVATFSGRLLEFCNYLTDPSLIHSMWFTFLAVQGDTQGGQGLAQHNARETLRHLLL